MFATLNSVGEGQVKNIWTDAIRSHTTLWGFLLNQDKELNYDKAVFFKKISFQLLVKIQGPAIVLISLKKFFGQCCMLYLTELVKNTMWGDLGWAQMVHKLLCTEVQH